MTIKKHPSYVYAKKVLQGKIIAPRYVIMQCADFLSVADGKDSSYKIDEKKVAKIDAILKLLYLHKGRKAGKTLYEVSSGYQWLTYVAVLCSVHRKNPDKRRYQKAVLEVCRKNYKTYTVAVILLLLFLLEPPFSRYFSVAPTGELSREVMLALSGIIKSSPALYDEDPRKSLFKIRRDDIIFKTKESVYKPLNYSNDKLDGKEPAAFVVDEAGVLPNAYAINAMQSGQSSVENPLGFVISTKYPKYINAFEDEVDVAKKVLDGIIEDDTLFALLYEPDEPDKWETDDNVLFQSNPVAQEDEELLKILKKKRTYAIEVESTRENFLTKHCNIIYQGQGTEHFVPIEVIQKCEVQKVSFEGLAVYVGVDLAMTNDNCAVSIVGVDDEGNLLIDCYCFIPEGRINEKNAFEKLDYREFMRAGKCIACGDLTVDYSVIEKFVFDIPKNFGCEIQAIGYDRFNALSSAQKWEQEFTTVQVRQHSDTLHPPTKLLKEKLFDKACFIEKNKLFEINFENARLTYDTNLNQYINKKRSNGKVDMVMATIDAVYLAQQDIIFDDGFVVQSA